MKKKEKVKFYRLDAIKSRNAIYSVIFGKRSNGKTYACLEEGIRDYVENGNQVALVRRWRDDFKGKNGQQMCDSLVANGVITKLTGGEWTGVYYYSSRWYFSRTDEEGKVIKDERPFMFAFSLSTMEHDKSTSYPGVRTIIFDEFISRNSYLVDEFVLFMNTVSTIVRNRDDVRIYMLGNTVNKYCPYFQEMGLTHVEKMKPGDIDVYTYGESGLTVAVEYADAPNKKEASDIYFAFDNPKLKMITEGEWEISVYPHCPVKYSKKDILFRYFIKFGRDTLAAEIVNVGDAMFTFIHQKTTPIQDKNALVFCPEYDPRPNYRRKITRPDNEILRKIYSFYRAEKVYYQDNPTGEIVRNYLMWCETDRIT